MSELMEELLEEEEEQTEERAPFVVDNDVKANWCLEQIAKKKAELKMWKAYYDQQKKATENTINSDIMWFEGSLRGYFMHVMDEGHTKTTPTGQIKYKLPRGTLVLKHQEPEYERDDSEIVEWLEKNAPDLVKIQKSPDWDGMKKRFGCSGDHMVTEDAEIIPGVKVVPREDKFGVEGVK